jgi:hypothetical protein
MSSLSPLVFIYLGEFPRYGEGAIKLAVETSGVPVVLVTDHEVPASIKRWSLRTQDFYDPESFKSTSHLILRSSEFRNGFWQKTLERLFVLQQFQRVSGDDNLFHAELDNLVFRLDSFESQVGQSLPNATLTLPYGSSDVALASLMYVRGTEPLDQLVHFANCGKNYSTEMHLLAAFGIEHPDVLVQAQSLESLTSATNFREKSTGSPFEAVGRNWMFDAAALGQWVAGQDAANSSALVSFNHFVNEAIAHTSLRPRTWLTDEGLLSVEVGDQFLSCYNLHLHHKIHTRIPTSRHLRALLPCARLPVRVPLRVNWSNIASAGRRAATRVRRGIGP